MPLPTSPAGTRIPRDGASLVDKWGGEWTIGPDGFAYWNGVRTNGHAASIDWDGTKVDFLSPTGAMWWTDVQPTSIVLKWTPLSRADPDPAPTLVWNLPPLPLNIEVGAQVDLKPYITASFQPNFRAVETDAISLDANGILTAKAAGTVTINLDVGPPGS